MAFLPEQSTWSEGIHQFEIIDGPQGGPDGIDNIPLKQLANRTGFLKDKFDNLLAGFRYLDMRVKAASTANVDVQTGGLIEIDGVALEEGDVVLLKDQTGRIENGLWVASSGEWERPPDYAEGSENVFDKKMIDIEAGALNIGKIFMIDALDTYVIGTDPLDFRETMFSPRGIPQKVLVRDREGKTEIDKKLFSLRLDLTSHADQVDGMGRNLLDVLGVTTIPEAMAALRIRCNNNGELDGSGIPNFRGLMIGDYLDGLDLSGVPAAPGGSAPQAWNDTYKNNRIVLSGFNTYKGSGDTENTKNHILFTFRNVIAHGYMNPTNTNEGGYPATVLRAWIEGASGDGSGSLAMKLKTALGGGYLLTVRRMLSTYGGRDWFSCTLFLPTEFEVFGDIAYSEKKTSDGLRIQIPIYQKSTDYRVKRYNGVRQLWWESSPFDGATVDFARVFYSGEIDSNRASHIYGISPVFCAC
jgi:hypothetical protein